MAKGILTSLCLLLSAVFLSPPSFAEEGQCGGIPCATSPSECQSKPITVDGKQKLVFPSNCLFLEEPIGGKPGFDLYVVECGVIVGGTPQCQYSKWTGGAITGNVRGPIQALLTRQAGKESQGSLGLLYNYLSLIYTYMSGLIIGISVLFVVIGGIQIATSHGDEGVTQGKSRIIKAITGIILWFTASLILYTINPTFFAF